MLLFFVHVCVASLFCFICTGYRPLMIILLCMHIFHWVLLAVGRDVLVRCCSMLLLNLNSHRSCAWCVAAASSSCTVCMLYDGIGPY